MPAELYRPDSMVRAAWRPRDRVPVATWAERHRILVDGYSAEPGPWRNDRTPYLVEVMNTFNDSEVTTIVFVSSARVGKTEGSNNMIGFAVDQDPGPILYVYPDQKSAEEECAERLQPMIEGSPRLRSNIPDAGWAAKRVLKLKGCRLYMAWAGGPRTLIRRTIRYVFIDELDNCDQEAGALGDTLKLAQKRLVTYRDRAKTVLCSTPTTPTGGSWRTWEASDKRQFYVPCPLCGAYQDLVFDKIRVPEGERNRNRIVLDQLAWYECEACRGRLRDAEHKRWMTARGLWVPEAQNIVECLPLDRPKIVERAVFNHPERWTPQLAGDKPRSRIAGFHIWAAYSPWVTWSDIVAEWFECKDDREQRIVFRNAVLGLPWEEVVNTTNSKALKEKIADALPRYVVPNESLRLVCGVDVQRSRIYFTVRAWGPQCESWLVDHGFFACMSDREDVLDVLERWYYHAFSGQTYRRVDGKTCRPIIALIDSGDGEVTRQIYEFCKVHPGCFACKGEDSNANHYVRKSITEPKRQLREVLHPLSHRQLWLVNSGKCKDSLYAFANKPGAGPNCFHVHAEVDDEYMQQFTAEHKVYDRTKKRDVWKSKTARRANHLLDCEVYGLAAAELVGGLSIVSGAQSSRPSKRARRPADARGFLSRYSHSI